jgi:hypothetical protein
MSRVSYVMTLHVERDSDEDGHGPTIYHQRLTSYMDNREAEGYIQWFYALMEIPHDVMLAVHQDLERRGIIHA